MKYFSIKLIIFAVLVLMFSCEKPERNNPWDEKAKLSPEAWAPQNLQIEDVSLTEKKLTWTYDDINIEGFKLDRKKVDEAWQEAYQTFPKEAREWSDSEIIPDTSLNYSYRLHAYAGQHKSSQQVISISATISAPTNLKTEKLTDKSYKLTWADNSNGEQGFKIDRKIDEGNWVLGYGNNVANQTSYTDTNVFRATNVEYRVYAFFESYESSKTTINANAELTAPTDLQLTNNSITSVTVSWKDNSTGEDGFKVERKYEGVTWAQLATISANTYEDNNFDLNTQVYYRVCAFVGTFNSSWAENDFDSTIPPPLDFQLTKNSITSVSLTWQDNCTGEDGFKIERKYESGSWESLTTVASNNYEDTDFDLNTQVYYRVCAYVGTYTSSWAENDFYATIPPPANPQIINNSITSVTINWQDSSTGEDGFKIERKYEGGNWESLATVTSNNYEDTDFDLNTQVYYRVSAYYGSYSSSWTETDFDATIPTPENLQITANSATSVTLSWDYNFTGNDGFKIDRKVNEGTWLEGFATVNSGTTYSDNGLDLFNNVYYYRIYAYYGLQYESLIIEGGTPNCGFPFTDSRDGNEYETVQIGDQCWMKENLAYLPSVSDPDNGSQTSPYYYVYGYEGTNVTEAKATSNYQTYGVLYNWPASLTVCPDGWSLPSDDEWTVLTDYLGGTSVAGGKMKEAGTAHWNSPNTGATNSSGFSGLPGGLRGYGGSIGNLGYNGYWWSSTEYTSTYAWRRKLYYDYESVNRNGDYKEYGFSVRCLRD